MARLLAKAKEVREALYPVLQQSAFAERGVLTLDEFVQAGDELVGQVSHLGRGAATRRDARTICQPTSSTWSRGTRCPVPNERRRSRLW